jgi:hypothetical protein
MRCSRSPSPWRAGLSVTDRQRSVAKTTCRSDARTVPSPRLGLLPRREALISSDSIRRASAGVSSSGTVGNSPARKRAANSGQAAGAWKLNPTVVRPNRACAVRHSGINADNSAPNAAAHASGVSGGSLGPTSAGARHPGVSSQPGGSSLKSSRITGPSVRSNRPSAAPPLAKCWNVL